MGQPVVDLPHIESLPRWGPFPRDGAWRWLEEDRDRWMGLMAYQQAMVDNGIPEAVALAIVSRLGSHGCEQVYWRAGAGGFIRSISVWWDVRVAVTHTPAAEAVRDVTAMGPTPVGATPLSFIERHPAVLQAYTSPVLHMQLKQRVRALDGRIAVPGRATATTRADHAAYAALAVGHIGATITTAHRTRSDAQESLVRLVELALRDLEST